jgi:tryptophan synthase alpha chain
VASSFIYYVSLTGGTGAAVGDLNYVAERASELQKVTGLPVAVGFGIKTPDDVHAISARADGAVVGSAVCSAIEQAPNADAAVTAVSQLVVALRAATIRTGL